MIRIYEIKSCRQDFVSDKNGKNTIAHFYLLLLGAIKKVPENRVD